MPMPDWHPDLQPDERTSLTQRLDYWRQSAAAHLEDLTWEEASTRVLSGTNLTAAGTVRHLAAIEDRWFHYRLAGSDWPEPWASVDRTVHDWSFQLHEADSVGGILTLYASACARSRQVAASATTLDATAPVPSFGTAPVTLRWVMTHLLVETACHTGHLDLLRDEILRART